ncbi:MAG: zinc ABC transporter substrate-binding protein, partial [Candidatus Heimdallarchaeota archaeon]|nr:zinc ABC transporter substrate-binding protein [Candidatus Heimdallarchaeota archaeon]
LISELQTTYYDMFNGLKVIVHHPSFMYLLDIIGVNRSGAIEEVEGVEPSAYHVQEIIDLMIEENISIIITQPQIEEDRVLQIARDTNAKLAKLTPLLGIEGAETYLDMIDYNMNALQNPEEVPPSNLATIMIIVGASVLGLTVIVFVYLRYIKK